MKNIVPVILAPHHSMETRLEISKFVLALDSVENPHLGPADMFFSYLLHSCFKLHPTDRALIKALKALGGKISYEALHTWMLSSKELSLNEIMLEVSSVENFGSSFSPRAGRIRFFEGAIEAGRMDVVQRLVRDAEYSEAAEPRPRWLATAAASNSIEMFEWVRERIPGQNLTADVRPPSALVKWPLLPLSTQLASPDPTHPQLNESSHLISQVTPSSSI